MKVVKMVDLTPGVNRAYEYFIATIIPNLFNVLSPTNLKVEGVRCGYYSLYEAFSYVYSRLNARYEASHNNPSLTLQQRSEKLDELRRLETILQQFVFNFIPNELAVPGIDVAERKVFFSSLNDPTRLNPMVHASGFQYFTQSINPIFQMTGQSVFKGITEKEFNEATEKAIMEFPKRDYLFFEEFIPLDYYFRFRGIGADYSDVNEEDSFGFNSQRALNGSSNDGIGIYAISQVPFEEDPFLYF